MNTETPFKYCRAKAPHTATRFCLKGEPVAVGDSVLIDTFENPAVVELFESIYRAVWPDGHGLRLDLAKHIRRAQ
jgi:hypothetical protein